MKVRYISMIGDHWNVHDTEIGAMEYGMKQAGDFTVVYQEYNSRKRRYKTIWQKTQELSRIAIRTVPVFTILKK